MKILIYCISLCAALLLGGMINEILPSDSYGFVFIENTSGESVANSTIRIRELEYLLPTIPNRGLIGRKFIIPGDSHYEINATLASGKKINLSSGYMTNGYNSYDLFVINRNTIDHQKIINLEKNTHIKK